MSAKFKKGDRVRVIHEINNQRGWKNVWVSDMNYAIGNEYTIGEIDPDEGIFFAVDDTDIVFEYGFPSAALELVED